MHTSTNAHAFSFHIIYWQMLEAHSRFGGYINTLPTGNPWSFPETLDKQKEDGALGLKGERDGKWYSTESSGSLDLSVMSWSSWQSRSYPAGIGQIGPRVHTLPFWKLVWREEREVGIWGGPAHTIGTSKFNFSGKHLTYVNCTALNTAISHQFQLERCISIPTGMARWLQRFLWRCL